MNLKLLKFMRFFHLLNKKKYNEKRQIEIVKKSPLFDAKWYLAQNPDVRARKIGAAKHYVKFGWKEGRNPSPDFDGNAYLYVYADIHNMCPLVHYILHGAKEKRDYKSRAKTVRSVIIPQRSSKKNIIYTCITGGYDNLSQHTCINKNYDYVCFTDNLDLIDKGQLGEWKILPLQFNKLDNIRNARWHKTHPHKLFPSYKYSIWVDGNIDIRNKKVYDEIDKLIANRTIFAAPLHPLRNCAYVESIFVKNLKKDTSEKVDEEIGYLRKQKYPKNNGLYETGFMLRQHNEPICRQTMDAWWNMIQKYSYRDQLSINFVCWKYKCPNIQLVTNKLWRDENGVAVLNASTHRAKTCENLPYVRCYRNYLYIDKDLIDTQIRKEKINLSNYRIDNMIVSLTSFPERINEVKYTIFSLLNQTVRPNKVILWLATVQFPRKEQELPKELLKFRRYGLEIRWTDDIKSYKKLIPAVKEYSEKIIVTVDDDIYYQENWLEKLYNEHLIYPDDIVAQRCHRITIEKEKILPYSLWKHCIVTVQAAFSNFFTGSGGVLYPPHSFYKDMLKNNLFMKICPTADDIWFWAMCVLNDKKIRVVKDSQKSLIMVNLKRELHIEEGYTLAKINLTGGNDIQMRHILKYYPILKEKIIQEKEVKVSIIVPVWNAEKYIKKCLDSLIGQTLKDIEIICVNDGSIDKSLDILKEYAKKDSRVKILNQVNQGQSVARNNGMKIAKGEFIGFCDNDDWVSENYFEDLYKAAIYYDTDIAATPNVFYVDPDTNKETRKATGIDLGKKVATNRGKIVVTTGLQWNKIYKKDFLIRHNISCTNIRVAAEDNFFTVQAMMYCSKLAIAESAKYYFYRRQNATSKLVKTKKDFCVIDLYKKIDELIYNSSLNEQDKKIWLGIVLERKNRDLSLFYNEMQVDSKEEFKELVKKEFPKVKLVERS